MKPTNLILISLLAFLCAFALAEFKSIANKIKVEEWLLIKKYGVISCYADGTTAANQSLPVNKNNGNTCPHQADALCFFVKNENKRNKIHKC
jgi:hypothetical protein